MELTKKQQDRLTSVKNKDELLSILKEYGFDGTLDDLKKQLVKQDKVELSDEELENVNGGIDLAYLFRLVLNEYGLPKLKELLDSDSK